MMTESETYTVYRCKRKEGMYLYTKAEQAIEELPRDLLNVTGELTEAMQVALTPTTKLARASADNVIKAIHTQGFYLQSPPNQWDDPAMLNVHNNNTKL